MSYEVLSDIVPSGPYDTYSQAVKVIESYGLKEHVPYSPWKGNLYVMVKSEHYWEGAFYWRDACRVCCKHRAYIIPENAKEVRSCPAWGDELPHMKKVIGDMVETWHTDVHELKWAHSEGLLSFDDGYWDAPTCSIGNVWFYFAGSEGEGLSWYEYIDAVGEDTVFEEIARVLNEPAENGIDLDESIYALNYIREGLHDACKKKEEQRRLAEQAERHAKFLKNLERYTDDELMAEIERRKAQKED